MAFIIVSRYGDGVGMAYVLRREGEEVCVVFKDKHYSTMLDGIVDKADTLNEAMKTYPDAPIIFDMTGYGEMANNLKKMGKMVVGAGMGKFKGQDLGDKLELDRVFALEFMKSFGIKIPDMQFFKGSQTQDAIAFVEKEQGSWVLKPQDNLSAALTSVTKTPEQLIALLEKLDGKMPKGFLLQRFTPGIEISTEIWFSNGKMVSGVNSTLETKKLFPGNLGEQTGCMSSVVWGYREKEPKAFQKSLKKIVKFMEGTGYTGPLDINCIIGKDGEMYGLEFSPRFGYSAIYAMMQCLDMPFGEFIHGIATGELDEIPWKQGFGAAIRVTHPPYPIETEDQGLNTKLYEFTKDYSVEADLSLDCYIPLDLYWDGDRLMTGGKTAIDFEVCGFADTIDELQSIYKQCKAITLTDKRWRNDMVKDAKFRWDQLADYGYVRREINDGA